MGRRLGIGFFLGLAACGGDSPTSTEALPMTREARWEQDLGVLARQLPELHVDLFARVPRARFEAEISALRGAIPSLDDSAIVVGTMRIVTLVGDSHTTLSHGRCRGFQRLPVAFDWFDDGIHVVAGSDAYRDLLGFRLLGIGGVSTEAVIEALRELVPHENDSWFRFSVVGLMVVPEILEAQGIVASASEVMLELRSREGEIVPIELPGVARGTELIELAPDPLPLYRRRPEENYWLSFVEDSQTLYVQYRRASDMPGESVASFSKPRPGFSRCESGEGFGDRPEK